jgi:phosphoribosylanthranilate isomerase
VIKVKICGINDTAGFDATVEAGADYVGFNFFPASPRYVTPAQAAALSARHSGGPLRVGLFVNPEPADIEAVLQVVTLDVLQLYTPPECAAALRRRFDIPVWRAHPVATRTDLPPDTAGADALLLEARPPEGASRPGGNATSFDWSVLAGWTAFYPWMLAGGLTPDNVAEAIAATGAACVDVSSGVERTRGVKDAALIRAFVGNARGSG